MTHAVRKRAELREARREATVQADRLAAMELAHARLQHLYEISKLLTQFEGVEPTVPQVVAILARTLVLCDVIFVLEAFETSQVIAWLTAGQGEDRLRAALAHAQATYQRLTGSGVDLDRGEIRVIALPPCPAPPPGREPGQGAILLPLVVARGSIFGALQIEGVAPLEEADLLFVSAVVSQLAIAVDRAAIIAAEVAAAAAREARLRFLAEATATLAASLDRRETLAALVRLAVPTLADVCFLDEIKEDGTVERIEVAFADEQKQHLAPRLRRALRSQEWPAALREVLTSGKPRLVQDPSLDDVARGEPERELMRAIGPRSLIVVPLRARHRVMGVLKLISTDSGRHFTASEVALAVEIGQRAGAALDNARLYEEAQRAKRARDDVLAVVSHDLKNHLAAILMSLAVVTTVTEQERKPLAVIRRSTDRMNHLIGDLLDVASIDAGRLAVEPQRQPVAQILSEALDAARPLAVRKSLRLEQSPAAPLPDVLADASRLQQVFENLLGNAIKFTPEGGSVRVAAAHTGAAVTFSVTDTGPGIDEAELPRVFDRFWQTQRTARLGTGLGLFIVKGIVEAHGGTIGVESRVGEGTKFFFTLPLVSPG